MTQIPKTQKKSRKRLLTGDDIKIEELLHIDSGKVRINDEETIDRKKWHYGLMKIKNANEHYTLTNVFMEYIYSSRGYDGSACNGLPYGLEFPPRVEVPMRYLIKDNIRELGDVDQVYFHRHLGWKEAAQHIRNDIVIKEYFPLADLRPLEIRYVIFMCDGWTNTVRVYGDVDCSNIDNDDE